jgi:tripartite-type tricarboxylate transporter receptor subunit TctC
MTGVAAAQGDYPSRTIKIIVPLPPGGVADALPRILADKLSARWGQSVIIENRPGAANNIGAEAAARSEPDGYTLLAAPAGSLVISQHFYPKLGFDPTSFVPVSVIGSLPIVLVANPKAPFSTLAEFIAFAKANPNKVTYGSPGVGSSFQLMSEMLQSTAGIHLTHVPYQGMAPVMRDLLAGHIDLTVDNLGNALPQLKVRKLKALGVVSKARLPELPDVPALAETFPEFNFTEWFAVVAPPRTPPEIAEKLSQAIAATLWQAEVAQKFGTFSVTPLGTSPAETAAFLKQESERWHKIIAATGVKAP